MKKTISVLVLILVAVFLLFSLLAGGSELAAEKAFYRVMKIHRKIISNPDVAPPIMLTAVENGLRGIIKKYPRSKTASVAHISLAQFLVGYKKYEQALSMADTIINKYGQNSSLAAQAQFLKGVAYERQNQWDRALGEYTILRDKYTHTQLGLQVPLYIGNYYRKNERYTEADLAYIEAIQYYRGIEEEGRGKLLGYTAANLMFQAYLKLKDYQQAGGVIEDIIEHYPTPLTLRQQLPKIELIFVQQLNNPKKAIAIYQQIIEKSDDQRLVKTLKQRIRTLEK